MFTDPSGSGESRASSCRIAWVCAHGRTGSDRRTRRSVAREFRRRRGGDRTHHQRHRASKRPTDTGIYLTNYGRCATASWTPAFPHAPESRQKADSRELPVAPRPFASSVATFAGDDPPPTYQSDHQRGRRGIGSSRPRRRPLYESSSSFSQYSAFRQHDGRVGGQDAFFLLTQKADNLTIHPAQGAGVPITDSRREPCSSRKPSDISPAFS